MSRTCGSAVHGRRECRSTVVAQQSTATAWKASISSMMTKSRARSTNSRTVTDRTGRPSIWMPTRMVPWMKLW
ncbi:hypothetical protein C6N75_07045 [Streptomyces solincola]|uniref:Uncharacterized protein n=1 Tax=Streptomyces solincola TaxID=2100817 RepID=A0A2S9PZQ5_9ACTN|nr:hypothetical protein C6N75_07045 [Streptomyces solincola]